MKPNWEYYAAVGRAFMAVASQPHEYVGAVAKIRKVVS